MTGQHCLSLSSFLLLPHLSKLGLEYVSQVEGRMGSDCSKERAVTIPSRPDISRVRDALYFAWLVV